MTSKSDEAFCLSLSTLNPKFGADFLFFATGSISVNLRCGKNKPTNKIMNFAHMINRFTKREDRRRKAKERTGGGKPKREDRRRKAQERGQEEESLRERTGGGKPKRGQEEESQGERTGGGKPRRERVAVPCRY